MPCFLLSKPLHGGIALLFLPCTFVDCGCGGVVCALTAMVWVLGSLLCLSELRPVDVDVNCVKGIHVSLTRNGAVGEVLLQFLMKADVCPRDLPGHG
eukprot:5617039-Amphidinium_carterae.1